MPTPADSRHWTPSRRGHLEVFGDKTPVIALKGQLGHSGGGSGITELLASILAYRSANGPGH